MKRTFKYNFTMNIILFIKSNNNVTYLSNEPSFISRKEFY